MGASFTMTARGALTTGAMTGLAGLAAVGIATAQPPAPAPTLEPDMVVGLATTLQAGVPCTIPGAARYLSMNVYRSPASTRELITALGELAVDLEVCAPIRSAASDQAAGLSETGLAADPMAAALARERIAQTFQEAETHAGTMRFEVGPPPRNLTRGTKDAP